MELIVEGRGSFLGKHQGRLRVTREQKMVTEVPLIHLERVLIIDSGVAISSDVVRVCSEEGIPIHFRALATVIQCPLGRTLGKKIKYLTELFCPWGELG